MAEATDRHPPVLRAVTVPVTHAGGQYAIRIETGRYRSLGQTLRQTFGDHPCAVVIVSNPKVARHYAAAVVESVAAAGFHPHLCLIPDGERYKTLRTVAQIWDFCVARQIERRDLLVALGVVSWATSPALPLRRTCAAWRSFSFLRPCWQ
ncbi:dehydroquinate synthase/iron-containing alcohol dehydrogenase family protein [Chloracidobacterium thermophilum]|uniref:hypothetical protein n=1 Tax=Chloracidobacterium thermophilum TaxID=458033 RepID=UPI001BB2E0DE|nr:hypothetical protein [Chloracidobacterium thermophilum]QUV78772.1 hypothetical protein J8C08_00300 [Chloracidobacterium thermophilum]